MQLIIDSMLRLQDVPDDILIQVKKDLTLKNPEYIKKRAMGLPRWAWGEEYINLWKEGTADGVKNYLLPRGYYARLWELVGPNMDLYDCRLLKDPVKFPQKPNLREYQAPVIELARLWQQGVPVMPCGAGKTESAMGIIADLEQPTLWITHTMDLLQQSMDRAVARLGLSGSQIGVIQGENMSIGTHITFATVQTLAKRNLAEIRNKFGCIVVDECHLVFKDAAKARMFESVISEFPAFYRFGVTASEHRSDGLITTMFHVIGPKFYEVSQADLNRAGNVVVPRVEFIETDFTYDQEVDEDGEKERLNVQQMVKSMRQDENRRLLVEGTLLYETFSDDCCIVLGHSLEYLEELQQFMLSYNHTAAFISGETPKKKREQIMADMRAGKYQYLFATYQLAKLGLDIPRLNKLILLTPVRDKTSIQQAVGRIMRPAEGKGQPVVYDIWDRNVPQLVHWARDRVKVYRGLGCEINGGPRVRK